MYSETHTLLGLIDISNVKRYTVQVNKDFGHKIGKYLNLIHQFKHLLAKLNKKKGL